MEKQQPQESLTVVLLPSGEQGIEALDVARSWAGEGLLKRTLWILADDVHPSPYGGASVLGHLLDEGQESTLDVHRVLSHTRLRMLTVVILQIASPGALADPIQLVAAGLLRDSIRNSGPDSLDAADGVDPIDIDTVNLIAGPTGLSGVHASEVTSQQHTANLIASPEDRRAADQMDRFVRPGENLTTWALAQCATVGGLWSGMRHDPWRQFCAAEGGESSSLAQDSFVLPVRGFARVVTSAPTARRALALAMAEVRSQHTNVLFSDTFVPVAEATPWIDKCLDAFDEVDGGRLAYVRPESAPAPGKSEQSVLRALADFLRFSGRELAGLPVFVFRRFNARWSHRATEILSGEEGHQVVTVLGESPDLDQFAAVFERQALDAKMNLAHFEGAPPPATPEIWRTLRQTVFGLLDGSTIPDPIPTPVIAEQRLVMPTTALVVPPPIPWAPSGEEFAELATQLGLGEVAVPSCSPWQADQVRSELAARQESESAICDQARIAAQEATDALLAAEAAASAANSDTAQAGADPVKAAPADGADESSSRKVLQAADASEQAASQVSGEAAGHPIPTMSTAALKVAAQRAKEEAEASERRLAGLARQEESLRQWLNVREASLLWRLAQRIQDRTLQSEADSKDFYEAATAVPAIDPLEPRRARNQFANRTLFAGSVVLLLLLLAAVLGQRVADWLPIPTWVIWAILAAVLIIWLGGILTSYNRRRSRFIARLRQEQFTHRDYQRMYRISARASSNLRGSYEQVVEWGEILGYAVNDPWEPDPDWFSGMPTEELAANLPTCVDLAVPDPTDTAGTRRLQRAALVAIAGEGWRARSFHTLLDLALAETTLGMQRSDYTLVDLDAPATPNGTRKLLLDMLRDHRLQREAARRVLYDKAEQLYAERATLTSHNLAAINSEYAAERTALLDTGGQLEFLRPAWGDFLGSVFNGASQFSRLLWSDLGRDRSDLRGKMSTMIFAPPGTPVVPKDFTPLVLEAASADRNRGVELSVRCDFGTPTETSSLALFSDEVQAEPPWANPQTPKPPPVGSLDGSMFN